jgi:hypothetical protein
MRTPLAKVRGLGSAKSGVHHWWHQRLTAIAMVPLVLSAIYLVFRIAGSDYNQANIPTSKSIPCRYFIVTDYNRILALYAWYSSSYRRLCGLGMGANYFNNDCKGNTHLACNVIGTISV